MAAHVVTQNPEIRQQIARLDVPLTVIAAERVGENQNRPVIRTFQPVE
jgi:hypothetical protein